MRYKQPQAYLDAVTRMPGAGKNEVRRVIFIRIHDEYTTSERGFDSVLFGDAQSAVAGYPPRTGAGRAARATDPDASASRRRCRGSAF